MLSAEEFLSLTNFEALLEDLEKKSDMGLRIKLTLRAIEDSLPKKIKFDSKDSIESFRLRNDADNLVYKEKGRIKALMTAWELYCKSIANARKDSSEIAQAYANRSAVLFNLRKIPECINDIDKAIENTNYPENFRPNLLRRKAKCLKIIGNSDAEKVCEEARSLLENLSLANDKKERLEHKMSEALETKEYQKYKEKHCEPSEPLEFQITPNDKVPAACNGIDIKYSREFGKHLIAKRDFNAGEIIIIERPYTIYLDRENTYSHCSQCFRRAWDSIPCDTCSYTMYCSKKCKSEAWEQYHDIECPLRVYFFNICKTEFAPMSLRLTILAIRESGSIGKLKKELEQIDDCKDYLLKSLSESKIYYSDKYKPLYNLDTHENSREINEILKLSLNVSLILYYSYMITPLFETKPDKSISTLYENENAMFIGKLIAHNYMIAQLNNQEFSEIQKDDHLMRLGVTIGPVVSLLNHSCNPNVNKCPMFKNDSIQQVVYALQPIKKGSQLVEDNGYNFAFKAKSVRDTFFEKMYFKCNCTACKENWPVFDELPTIGTVIPEEEKGKRLDAARALVRSKQQQRIVFSVGLHKYDGDKMNILRKLANSITIVAESTDKPCKDYSELLELYRQTFMHIHGCKFNVNDALCIL